MRHFRDAAIVCAMLSVAACSHATQSSSPGHHVAPQPHVTHVPPTPTATPSPIASARPPRVLPSAVLRHVVLLPPNAAPKILGIAMSETTIHRGDHVSGSVVTTSNVASVQARIGGYAVSFNKVGVGRFAIAYLVNVPWFVRGDYDLHIIATNTGGATVERVILLKVR